MTAVEHEIVELCIDIRETLGVIRNDLRELLSPINALENHCRNISCRLNCIDSRIERIERRLDLTDA